MKILNFTVETLEEWNGKGEGFSYYFVLKCNNREIWRSHDIGYIDYPDADDDAEDMVIDMLKKVLSE